MAANFKIAPMHGLILVITIIMLALPFVFLAAAILGSKFFIVPAIVLLAVYLWIWLRFRPRNFVVQSDSLEVIWPLKLRQISRSNIQQVRTITRTELKNEIGWGLRVGAGGIWGGFGWLWTQKRGIVQMYISRTDAFVWIKCSVGRPWLITPERPEDFVRALSDKT